MPTAKQPSRCTWCSGDPIMLAYHDEEWGVPLWDDRQLFEFLVLEGAQAGLSWRTILHRRDGYRAAFDAFAVERVARYDKRRLEKLLKDARIIRNRLKVESAVHNARAFLQVRDEFGSFAAYQWRFVDGRPVQNVWRTLKELPAQTPLSETLSKDLRQRGFRFVGPTIVYAHMQAVGMVNDHVVECFRHRQVRGLARRPGVAK